MKYIRASLRAVVGVALIPAFVVASAVQGFVVGPLLKNQTMIPNLLYKSLARLLGYKVIFNKNSAPLEKNRQTWFVANHMSIADFVVLGAKLNGTFIGKGDILKWPGIAQMARAVKYIGLRRDRKYNPQSRAKIIKNFNKGHNAIMFPEGTTSDGKQVYLFRAPLMTPLFGETGVDSSNREVALDKKVVVQPVAISVTSATGHAGDARDAYSMFHNEKTLNRIWNRLMIRRTVLELTAFAPLDPADYANEKDMINKAALDIASVVNPGQTTFVKAKIPGYDEKAAVTPASALASPTAPELKP